MTDISTISDLCDIELNYVFFIHHIRFIRKQTKLLIRDLVIFTISF